MNEPGDIRRKHVRRKVKRPRRAWTTMRRKSPAHCASLGREPTQREFAEHIIGRFRSDPPVPAMAIEAAKRAGEEPPEGTDASE